LKYLKGKGRLENLTIDGRIIKRNPEIFVIEGYILEMCPAWDYYW
jgi:hypothetical protein